MEDGVRRSATLVRVGDDPVIIPKNPAAAAFYYKEYLRCCGNDARAIRKAATALGIIHFRGARGNSRIVGVDSSYPSILPSREEASAYLYVAVFSPGQSLDSQAESLLEQMGLTTDEDASARARAEEIMRTIRQR